MIFIRDINFCIGKMPNLQRFNRLLFVSIFLPFNDFKSPLFEWCDDAVEFGVVDTADIGEPGRMSFGVVLPADLLSVLISESELLDTFCWAIRSCLRNFARRF